MNNFKHFLYGCPKIYLLLFCYVSGHSQRIGVGTAAPLKLLSINGSVMIDQTNKNLGSLDSAALVFGSSAQVGIFSRKTVGDNQNGLNFLTNGQTRMMIGSGGTVSIPGNAIIGGTLNLTGAGIVDDNFRINGRIGIGGATDAGYKLFVHDGPSFLEGNTIMFGDANVTNNLTVNSSQLVGNTLRVNGGISINAAPSNTYKLNVAGDANITGDLRIKGNGHVRSNGTSSLRFGFDQRTINNFISSGAYLDFTANISDFDNGAADVRVFISQYISDPDPAYDDYWHLFTMAVHSVDHTNNTCKIRIRNTSGTGRTLKGVLYLASVAKD